MSWVMVIVVVFSRFERSRITSSISAVVTGSSPVVGSSKRRISGSWAIARAKPTRRRMPPESCEGSLSLTPSSRTISRHSSTRSSISPCDIFVSRCRGKATFCQTVIESNSAPSWKAMPNLRRNSVISRLPSVSTVDAVDLDGAGVGLAAGR